MTHRFILSKMFVLGRHLQFRREGRSRLHLLLCCWARAEAIDAHQWGKPYWLIVSSSFQTIILTPRSAPCPGVPKRFSLGPLPSSAPVAPLLAVQLLTAGADRVTRHWRGCAFGPSLRGTPPPFLPAQRCLFFWIRDLGARPR